MSYSSSTKKRIYDNYGPWAIVTGASSGIGKAIAYRLAEANLNVVLVARRKEALQNIAKGLKEQYEVETNVVAADVSKEAGIHELITATSGMDIGLLVAAAGYGTSGSFLDADINDELNMLDVNCKAVLVLTHHYAQQFAAKSRGGIILMASLVGFQGTPFAAHYAATKAYNQSLAEALHVELKDKGVDVLAAAPGPVNSGFASRADMQMGAAMTPEQVAVPILKALGRRQTILPGFLTKFLVGSLTFLPRWGKVRVMKLVMGGMTKHQRA